MPLFLQASFDMTRLTDYGVTGLMLGVTLLTLRSIALAYRKTLEDGRIDARNDLATERKARQDFEARVTTILDQLVKTTAELTKQVGQKREAIDQLSAVITDLVSLVNGLKGRTSQGAT